jgi:putative heme iron utilization protein
MPSTDPLRPVDDEARQIARDLIAGANHAALAVIRTGTPLPSISRIALATTEDGTPLTLISELAPHFQALAATPDCALLVGDPGDKGDPLTHPRLTLHARAQIVLRDTPEHATLRARYLSQRPKSKLYIDFADFRLVRFRVTDALLNAGFGKAYRLGPHDITA